MTRQPKPRQAMCIKCGWRGDATAMPLSSAIVCRGGRVEMKGGRVCRRCLAQEIADAQQEVIAALPCPSCRWGIESPRSREAGGSGWECGRECYTACNPLRFARCLEPRP